MSDRGENEAMQVRLGLAENDESPWEWGTYIERNDRGNWTPHVYGGFSYEEAHQKWRLDCALVAREPDSWRNPRIVRRAVSPWEVRNHA